MRRLGIALLALLPLGCARPASKFPGQTVVWLCPADDHRPMVEELIHSFEEKNKDVHVDLRWVPGSQYQTKLKTLIAAGEAPDVLYCGDVWIAYLKPFLADLTDLAKRDVNDVAFDDLYPAVQRACRPGGRIYFLPRWFNLSLLYYNRKLFKEANEPLPTANWTWNDYAHAGERLTRRDAKGQVVTWGSNITTGWWGEWLTLVRESGGDLFDSGITHCTLDTPEAIRGLTFYRDKIGSLGFAPAPGVGPANAFASGKLAMDYGGHTGLWATYRKIPGLDWDIEALPRGPSGRRGGEIAIDALGIAKTSKVQEAAWRFVKFMASRESIRRHVKEGFLSVRRSIAKETRTDALPPHNFAAIERALETAEPIPSSPDFIEVALDIVQPEIDRMLTDGTSPKQTAKNAVREADAFLRTMGSAAKG